jgi:hypothetical protein
MDLRARMVTPQNRKHRPVNATKPADRWAGYAMPTFHPVACPSRWAENSPGQGSPFAPVSLCSAVSRGSTVGDVSRMSHRLEFDLECELYERRVSRRAQPNSRRSPVLPRPMRGSNAVCTAWGEGRGEEPSPHAENPQRSTGVGRGRALWRARVQCRSLRRPEVPLRVIPTKLSDPVRFCRGNLAGFPSRFRLND